MSSQGFSFPPPPPPPPVAQQHAYPSAHGNGHWNGRGAGGGRGRGRGYGARGRGGHFPADTTRSSYPNVGGYSSTTGNFAYPAQPMPSAPYMNPSPYPHAQSTYQPTPNPPAYPPPHAYSPPAGSAPYQPLTAYNGPANLAHPQYPSQSAPTYPPPVPPPQHGSPPNTPAMMNNMHWGNDTHSSYSGPSSGYGHGHGHPHGHGSGSGRGRGSHPHGNHGSKPRYPNKRDHASAFNKPASAPKVPAAPAVPSFGNPLPCKPPPAADATRKPKKRKRKHNQLGLTPKTEDHESSEEEEDVDEEAKLAPDSGPLQISYKGRTSTLQSAADIAAWIAERKKKFPTQARIEEKKKAAEEAKAARETARLEKEQEREKERERIKTESATKHKNDASVHGDTALLDDAAKKAQRKADKIRRTLAKAEAEAEAARLKVEQLQKQVQGLKQESPTPSTDPSNEPGLSASKNEVDPVKVKVEPTETPRDQASISATTSHLGDLTVEADGDSAMDVNVMDVNGDSSDWTSSSGSESESESDDDSAPEVASSRREGPERVAPPPREGKKAVCRHFARTGQCNRGEKCKFSHEATERPKKVVEPKEKKGRKGLFQALLEQQKAEEDKRAMEVISWLGQNGLLEATSNTNMNMNGCPTEDH
ncbi:hypothetical protein N7488_010426 [Penicillium malachiteum]|nr:hypothetical protein N7488_010426 [Penicillium malachiteum]